MFLDKLTCSNCKKEINQNEDICIKVNAKDLKGMTYLKSWATMQYILCSDCFEK